jgi:hypothetical protein
MVSPGEESMMPTGKRLSRIATILVLMAECGCLLGRAARADELPKTPRIDSVVMSRPQPHESDPAVIWYDLFYRLTTLRIVVPPLRDRREDIDMIVENTLAELAGEG